MLSCFQRNGFSGGVNLVTAVFFIPLTEIRRLVHVFDDLTPADAGVVGAEGYFTFLRTVRNHAHLSAPKIVIEKILEPHAFNTQYAPDVGVLRASLHSVVAIRTGIR